MTWGSEHLVFTRRHEITVFARRPQAAVAI
jgi:hypothetical protein